MVRSWDTPQALQLLSHHARGSSFMRTRHDSLPNASWTCAVPPVAGAAVLATAMLWVQPQQVPAVVMHGSARVWWEGAALPRRPMLAQTAKPLHSAAPPLQSRSTPCRAQARPSLVLSVHPLLLRPRIRHSHCCVELASLLVSCFLGWGHRCWARCHHRRCRGHWVLPTICQAPHPSAVRS